MRIFLHLLDSVVIGGATAVDANYADALLDLLLSKEVAHFQVSPDVILYATFQIVPSDSVLAQSIRIVVHQLGNATPFHRIRFLDQKEPKHQYHLRRSIVRRSFKSCRSQIRDFTRPT